jgi:hypothetical protein
MTAQTIRPAEPSNRHAYGDERNWEELKFTTVAKLRFCVYAPSGSGPSLQVLLPEVYIINHAEKSLLAFPPSREWIRPIDDCHQLC